MKAMILSAGLGTRLRPLTLSTPKALLLVDNHPMIDYCLRLLKKHGFSEAVINLHHLGDLIEKALGDGRRWGMKLHYSHEREILGTGGGIRKAARFFKGETLLVVNSDILIDVSLKALIRFHKKKKGIATMVVRPREANSGFSSIRMTRGNRILGIEEPPETRPKGPLRGRLDPALPVEGATRAPVIDEGAKQGDTMYTGVQILEPRILEYLPATGPSCIIRQGYLPALTAKEKIFGFPYGGYWTDLGTMDRYRQAEKDLQGGKVRLSFI